MPDIKIADLAAYTDPVSTDVLPIVDVGNDLTKKVSIADLLENAGTGTAAAPSFSFDGDNDTGIYQPGVNQIAITTGGTQRLLVDSSGNVGIGTTNPSHKFQVHEPSNATVRIQLSNGGTGSGGSDGFQIIQNGLSQSNKVNLLNYENSALGLWTNNSERLQITSSGNVLIGGTLPSAPNITLNANGTLTTPNSQLSNNGFFSTQRDQNTRATLATFTHVGQRSLTIQGQWGSQDIGVSNGILLHTDGGSLGFRSSSSGDADFILNNGSAQFAGSVSIGGTAAANTIDEYEEGTFSPDFKIGSTNVGLTGNNALGNYTRIGNLCQVTVIIIASSTDVTGLTGNLAVTGLPFTTPNNLGSNYTTAAVGTDGFASDYRTGNKTIYLAIAANSTFFALFNGAKNSGVLTENDLDFSYGACSLYATVTYRIV